MGAFKHIAVVVEETCANCKDLNCNGCTIKVDLGDDIAVVSGISHEVLYTYNKRREEKASERCGAWILSSMRQAMATAVLLLALCVSAYAHVDDALAVRAIIGEASNQGYAGMLAVACGIRNRDTLKGVYGVKAKHVDNEPKYVWDMARRAWAESETNRIHNGTHWENIKAFGKPYWVDSMTKVYECKDHIFYKK